MTIREHIALPRHDLEIKRTAFFLAQDLLLAEGNGFQDRSLFERLSQAETEWVQASSAYRIFVNQVFNNRLNPDAEMD